MKIQINIQIQIHQTYRDDPDEKEGVEDEDDEHGSLHLPRVDGLLLHEEAVVPVLTHLKIILMYFVCI